MSTYCVIQSSYEKKKKLQHFFLQILSTQTEANMQQNSCFRHLGYRAHMMMICLAPGQAYRLGDGRVMYGWLTAT